MKLVKDTGQLEKKQQVSDQSAEEAIETIIQENTMNVNTK